MNSKNIILAGCFFIFSMVACTKQDSVNIPPDKPHLIKPFDLDTLTTTIVEFTWRAADRDNDQLQFDFYFGPFNNSSLKASRLTSFKTNIEGISSGHYQWYVVANDGSNQVQSDIFSFSVLNPEDLPQLAACILLDSKKGQAKVSSAVSSVEEIIAKGFVWGRHSSPDFSNDWSYVEGTGETFSWTIPELYDGTKYFVRAFARNSIGVAFSEELQFTSWDDGVQNGSFVDDRDNRTYQFSRIGTQKWMTTNLSYLPNVNLPEEESYMEPKYYVHDYFGDLINEATATEYYRNYGVLYNWTAAVQESDLSMFKVKGVCPDGWHLPSNEEWLILIDFLGGHDEAGGLLKETGFDHWHVPNTGATDKYGFRALPGGSRGVGDEPFQPLGTRGFWWSATEVDEVFAKRFYLYNEFRAIGEFYQDKRVGFSVRCIKD